MNGYEIRVDNRIFNNPRYYLVEPGAYDMQVVPDKVRRCVAFLSYRADGQEYMAGTAFFISLPIREGLWARYIVTAKHVIEYAKANSGDGSIYYTA